MAGNKSSPSQAEQAARVQKNTRAGRTSNTKNAATSRKAPAPAKAQKVSPQTLMGLLCLGLFFVMWGIGFSEEGMLLKIARNGLYGLFGIGAVKVGIFCPLFLAVSFLHRKRKNMPFKIRCVIGFVLCFGIVHHLIVNEATVDTHGITVVGEFFEQGILGASGGVVCGAIAFVLRWAFGKPFSLVLVSIIWLLALLGAVGITIPDIIQAIRNRMPGPDDNNGDGPAGAVAVRGGGKGDDGGSNPSERVVAAVADFMDGCRARGEKRRARREQAYEDMYDDYEDDYDEEEDVVWENRFRKFFSRKEHSCQAEPVVKQPNPTQQWEKSARQSNSFQNEGRTAARSNPVRRGSEESNVRSAAFDFDSEFSTPGAAAPAVVAAPAHTPYFEEDPPAAPVVKPDPAVRKVTANEAAASAQEVTMEIEQKKAAPKVAYKYPPIDLLKIPGRSSADGTAEMKRNSQRLNETLASFKIDAHIINVTRGPSVTRYEVELDKGVRLNKLTTVSDDIALSLGVTSVRIAPVPGKISVVGIEVPNQAVTTVALREVIDSREFKASHSKSTFSVGKDIGGSCIVGNIAKMPHMLIAGTTGSGKSVCMNSIIISLLYKAAPDEVKLIMVDPKMVELGIYNDIPHLLIPVVTDPKKAAGSLQWAVTEMMRRYKLMSDAGVRDLESFNSIVESEEGGEKLPQVVIIIDELADLMLVAAKEVEDSICRIAQMGRAAGMHLIIATQRPSADVITGLMKANIPSRIAFSVASAMESRIILDTVGAEKLVGKGDMLFAPIGTGKPQRVQGCFVTDGEVEAVATFVKEHFKASYDTSVIDEIEKSALQTGKKSSAPEPEANSEEMEGDEMLPQAVEVVFDSKQASVSMLQRRLKLGYARAARIMDEMEEKGIVGPNQGSKPREILITREQWATLKQQLYPGLADAAQAEQIELPF